MMAAQSPFRLARRFVSTTTHAAASAIRPPYPIIGGIDRDGTHVCGHGCDHHSHERGAVASLHSGSKKNGNRGVVYMKPGVVEVHDLPFPKLELNHPSQQRKCQHGVILKTIATNICGSDQHMVRGRTTAPAGLVLGHEITGEVVEVGRDVEFLRVGDVVSVPFNVACGRCDNCKRGQTGICLNVNPARAGGAYGYVDMGGWQGGQAEYSMIPYADFNCLKLPQGAMSKILDLTMLSDIFPTGFHGAVTAGVGPGSTVYIAGAGPVGLAAAASAQLLGAAAVIVGDLNPARLAAVTSMGAIPLNVASGEPMPEALARILGSGQTEVDAGVDCVGFEASGTGKAAGREAPAQVLNDLMAAVRAGGALGVPGLYVTDDPGGVDDAAKIGALSLRLGLGWAKSQSIAMGQCPVIKYHKQLMRAIMHDRVQIAKAVNATLISLDEAPAAYRAFDAGAPRKFVIDPHGEVRKAHPNAPRL